MGVDVRGQAVFGVVGHLDHFVVATISGNASHGGKVLFPPYFHLRCHSGQQHWHKEVVARRLALVARHHRSALGDRVVHNRGCFFDRLAVNERAKINFAVQAIAHGEGRHTLGELGHELIVNRFVYQNPVSS